MCSFSSLHSCHVCCVKWNGYFSQSKKFVFGQQGVKETETLGQWKVKSVKNIKLYQEYDFHSTMTDE